MKIAVVALGKIGLPLAVQFADADPSHEVVGVDVNQRVVDLVNAGQEPFPGEAHLGEKLAEEPPETVAKEKVDWPRPLEHDQDLEVIARLPPVRRNSRADHGYVDRALLA